MQIFKYKKKTFRKIKKKIKTIMNFCPTRGHMWRTLLLVVTINYKESEICISLTGLNKLHLFFTYTPLYDRN